MANNVSENAIHYGCRLVLNDDYIYASLGKLAHDMMPRPSHPCWCHHQLHHVAVYQRTTPDQMGGPGNFVKGPPQPTRPCDPSGHGALWSHEHGPRGGDEINVITGGDNYGWPTVSHGKEYIGGTIGIGTSAPGFADPAWVWTPSIAPSGMAFYKGRCFHASTGIFWSAH